MNPFENSSREIILNTESALCIKKFIIYDAQKMVKGATDYVNYDTMK